MRKETCCPTNYTSWHFRPWNASILARSVYWRFIFARIRTNWSWILLLSLWRVSCSNIVDSQSAITARFSNSMMGNSLASDCRARLAKLRERTYNAIVQWVPSNVGINGNERADILTKAGSDQPRPAIIYRQMSKLHTSGPILQMECNWPRPSPGTPVGSVPALKPR